jgi:putative oxidoreductase
MRQSVVSNSQKRAWFYPLSSKRRLVFIHIISALLVLMFSYASFSKLVDVKTFTGQMNNQPFPNWMTPYLVWGIPTIELLIVAALLFDKTRKLGMWSSFLLMSAFTVYVSLAVFKIFDRIPCSCGGVLSKMGWMEHFYFNAFFTLLSLLGIYLIRKHAKDSSMQY